MDESSKRWADNTERERDKLIPTRDVHFNNHNSLHHHVLRQACLVVESYLVPSIACKFLLRFPRSSRLVEETTSLDFCILLCLRCGIIVCYYSTLFQCSWSDRDLNALVSLIIISHNDKSLTSIMQRDLWKKKSMFGGSRTGRVARILPIIYNAYTIIS